MRKSSVLGFQTHFRRSARYVRARQGRGLEALSKRVQHGNYNTETCIEQKGNISKLLSAITLIPGADISGRDAIARSSPASTLSQQEEEMLMKDGWLQAGPLMRRSVLPAALRIAGCAGLLLIGMATAAMADCQPWQINCNGRAANGGTIDGYGNTWTQNPGGTYSDQKGRSWSQSVNGGWQRSDGYSVQKNMGGGYTDSTGETFTQALGGGWIGSRGTTCSQQVSGVWSCGK